MIPTTARSEFGCLADGRAVDAVTLSAGRICATVIAFGATLQSLWLPDRAGNMDDVVLGHDDVMPYAATPNFLGATVGRYANRIAGGRFELEGAQYTLSRNDGGNSLHGGSDGFDKRLWLIEAHGADEESAFVTLSLLSPDGDQGYPGNLRVWVTYRLSATALIIDYEARCDRVTIVNLTNHTLWNLRGANRPGSILDHELTLAADAYTPVDERLIPTGELRDVTDTVFDFRNGRTVGDGVRAGSDPQIRIGRGYDHNFALRGGRTSTPKPAATLHDPLSGRGVHLQTTEPGLQVYSGNFLDGTLIGKSGRLYRQGDGLALETQAFPDAPNQPHFPSARLEAGETYRQTTGHVFFVL